MAKAALGTKRKCLNCGAAFFDLHHDPIVCPKCEAVFTPIPLPRTVGYKAKPRIPAEQATPARPVAVAAYAEREDENPEVTDGDDSDGPNPQEEPDDDILPLQDD